jgi:hypothetical protein
MLMPQAKRRGPVPLAPEHKVRTVGWAFKPDLIERVRKHSEGKESQAKFVARAIEKLLAEEKGK